jgi:hypothetical protein
MHVEERGNLFPRVLVDREYVSSRAGVIDQDIENAAVRPNHLRNLGSKLMRANVRNDRVDIA